MSKCYVVHGIGISTAGNVDSFMFITLGTGVGGHVCGCGGKGCFKQYASTNDPIARKVYHQFIENISNGLVNVVHLLDSGLIILGGGISEIGEDFFKVINVKLQKKIMPAYRPHTIVKRASLGNDAGLFGAYRLFHI